MGSGWDRLLAEGETHHLVHFYGGDEPLLVTKVAHYLREGWRADDALLAIGTAQRNLAIAEQLYALGVNVPAAVNAGRLVFFDAEEMLARLTASGRPDWARFDALLGSTIRHFRERYARVRAYGEMVGVLWSRSQYDAALRIEEFWNRLLGVSGTALFCAYPIDVLGKEVDCRAVDAVLCAHTHMLPVRPGGELEQAVDRAMNDVLGDRAEGLKKLVDSYFRPSWAAVPKPEAMVFWLRSNLPQYADRILDRARVYYRAA